MLIGIDGNEANIVNRVGVNWYAYEILWAIYKLQGKRNGIHNFVIYLKDAPLSDLPKESDNWKYEVLPGRGLWLLTKLTPYLYFAKTKPNILFSPSHYTVPISIVPRVCSIMDLGYLEFSGQFKKTTFWQLKLWTAISIIVSKYIISISNATKKDIVRHYPFASKKVVVTLLAYDKQRFNTEISIDDVRRIKIKYSIVGDYILFLSTLKPSKNVEGVIDAFNLLNKDSNLKGKYKLIVAGKKGWFYKSIYDKVRSYNLQKEVIFTDFIEESDKGALMRGAKLMVSPSFWEGFGLHVLESMACGIPVVVSNTGSYPEVVEEAGIMVDPYKIESITEGIKKVLNMDEKSYNRLSLKCIAQADKFQWEKTAKETLKVLEQI